MISIRLTRVGKKKHPIFRVIAIDKQRDPWGRALEILGVVDPRTKERTLKADRIKHWLSVGAQPSDTVRNLLIDEKIMEGKKVTSSTISKKRSAKLGDKVKAETERVAAAKEAAATKEAEEKAAKEAEVAAAKEAKAAPVEEAPAEAEAEAPKEEAEATPEAAETKE